MGDKPTRREASGGGAPEGLVRLTDALFIRSQDASDHKILDEGHGVQLVQLVHFVSCDAWTGVLDFDHPSSHFRPPRQACLAMKKLLFTID